MRCNKGVGSMCEHCGAAWLDMAGDLAARTQQRQTTTTQGVPVPVLLQAHPLLTSSRRCTLLTPAAELWAALCSVSSKMSRPQGRRSPTPGGLPAATWVDSRLCSMLLDWQAGGMRAWASLVPAPMLLQDGGPWPGLRRGRMCLNVTERCQPRPVLLQDGGHWHGRRRSPCARCHGPHRPPPAVQGESGAREWAQPRLPVERRSLMLPPGSSHTPCRP